MAEQNNFALLALVGIVAVVGIVGLLVVALNGGSAKKISAESYATDSSASDNLAGDAKRCPRSCVDQALQAGSSGGTNQILAACCK